MKPNIFTKFKIFIKLMINFKYNIWQMLKMTQYLQDHQKENYIYGNSKNQLKKEV
jgi:hypothetical protein